VLVIVKVHVVEVDDPGVNALQRNAKERPRAHPFKPTAGATPPLLIARQSTIEEFTESIEDGQGVRAGRRTGA
jgi:hypothetical protein